MALTGSFILLVALLVGCGTTRTNVPAEEPPMHSITEFRDQRFAEVADPFEEFNRSMYRFNFYFDRYFFIPVVTSYECVTPQYLQERISGFYRNVEELQNFSNSLFQLKAAESVITLGRFVTNSTIGLAGLFDPATTFGLERHNQDFGKTLGYWGVASGAYLVLPFFGPSSLRDSGGLLVDRGFRYGIFSAVDSLADTRNFLDITIAISALEAVDARHQQSFRYFESGYPFEYYMVRFLYHEKRNIESGTPLPAN
jgi:phospholipid-binding lipoprotein MlaA